MIKKYLHSGVAFVVCVLIAAEGFAAGKIVIQPNIEMALKNNSNFWRTEDKEVSVNTYSISPGIVFGFETPKTNIALDAKVEAYWYDDQDTLPVGITDASDDDYVGFSGELKVNHQLTDRFNIGVKDEIYVTRDPSRADYNSNSIARDKYTINYFEPNVYYEIEEKYGILAKYRNTVTNYEKNLEDSYEHRGILDLYYIMNRSSALYLDYQVWERTYSDNSVDYVSNMLSLNYEKKFNYFAINGGAGYHERSFDDATLDDLGMFSWKIQLKGQDPDATLRTTRSRIKLELGQEMNDDGTGDNYYKATYLDLEGGYRFFRTLELSAKAGFQNSKYETDPRDEDTYLGSVRLAYQPVDFLILGLEGGFETRDSNTIGNSYDDTYVMLTLDFAYDLGSR